MDKMFIQIGEDKLFIASFHLQFNLLFISYLLKNHFFTTLANMKAKQKVQVQQNNENNEKSGYGSVKCG